MKLKTIAAATVATSIVYGLCYIKELPFAWWHLPTIIFGATIATLMITHIVVDTVDSL